MSITGGMFSTSTPNAQYYFFYDMTITAECNSARTPVVAFVKPAPAINIAASINTTICPGTTVDLSATSTNDFNYNYTWNPGILPGANVSVTAGLPTTYTVPVCDTTTGVFAGCKGTASVLVNVFPAAPTFTLNPALAYKCAPDTFELNVMDNPNVTGADTLGTSLLNANGFTNFPAPYGGNNESVKHQILILASELSASGMTYGSEINTLAFSVGNLGAAGILNNYAMSIAPTNVTVLTTWTTTGLVPVFVQ